MRQWLQAVIVAATVTACTGIPDRTLKLRKGRGRGGKQWAGAHTQPTVPEDKTSLQAQNIAMNLATPMAAQVRATLNASVICADVWDQPRTMDANDGTTCGQMVMNEVVHQGQLRVDGMQAAHSVATRYPACAPCGFSQSAEDIAEFDHPKVQCLADCLPGGKSHGMDFCPANLWGMGKTGRGASTDKRYEATTRLLARAGFNNNATAVRRSVQACDSADSWSCYLNRYKDELQGHSVRSTSDARDHFAKFGYYQRHTCECDVQESCLARGDNETELLVLARARGPAAMLEVPDRWPSKHMYPEMKIVINSGAGRSEVPRDVLLQSLADSAFDQWNRVVLVIGGDEVDAPPELVPVISVVPGLASRLKSADVKLVQVRTKLMNFDLHGLAMLARWRDHPLLWARGYFYTLETAQFRHDFATRLDQLDQQLATASTILTTTPPNANVYVLGRDVVSSFGQNFEQLQTKHQGLAVESGMPFDVRLGCDAEADPNLVLAKQSDKDPRGWNQEPCRSKTAGIVYPVIAYGDVHFLGRRTLQCRNCTVFDKHARNDVYNTGEARVVTVYPQFGLNKFCEWGGSGDLSTIQGTQIGQRS